MPKRIEKAYFTTVVVLRGSCKPVYVRERPDKVVLTSEEVVVQHVQAGLFMCYGGPRKQFSPLWRSCEAHASLFMCVKDLITPF